MNAHITKPIDPGLLLETLARWVPSGEPRRRASAVSASSAGRRRAAMTGKPALPEDLPGFDLAEGLHRLQGNDALYCRLLLDFADQHRHEIDALRRALDKGDVGHVRHRVHAIKGVAGNLAAKPLQEAAAGLEGLIQSVDSVAAADAAALASALDAFTAALEIALNAADSLISAAGDRRQPGAGGVAAPTPAQAMAADITSGLRAAAELGDVSELIALAQASSARPGELSAIGERIRRMAEGFDFDGILMLVAELEARR